MRKAVQHKILQLLMTLKEAHSEIRSYLQKKDAQKVNGLLADCQQCALTIGNTIEEVGTAYGEIINDLEKYCEQLFKISVSLEQDELIKPNELKKNLDRYIKTLYNEIKYTIKTELKIVFFPYKASMWTSLESIWKAAQEDRNCDVKVVVIPYYTLDSDGNESKFNYEADLFPNYVPVIHYNDYFLEKERPDMIFIHNPYDGANNVTRVPEKYYSYNLKPYTEQLIYSPYGMMGYYSPKQKAFMCYTNAAQMSSKVLVQSEKVKQIYVEHGIAENKLIALGSPKVDAIVESQKKPKVYPEKWEEKLAGRKVFLLNTHLSYFIIGYNYQQKYGTKRNYSEYAHEVVFNTLLNQKNLALIWRPPPLLKATLESRKLFSTLDFIDKWEHQISESANGVLDITGDYTVSFRLSDALLTTYSSIIPEYMISGKPIYIFQHRLNENNCRNSPVSYIHNYYRARSGEEAQFPKFVQMILDGEDPLYEKRMEDVHRAFKNLDGTIGQMIYEKLKNE